MKRAEDGFARTSVDLGRGGPRNWTIGDMLDQMDAAAVDHAGGGAVGIAPREDWALVITRDEALARQLVDTAERYARRAARRGGRHA